MFKHIFVPTDGSELSRATAQRAVSFAKEAGARITVFFAKPEYPIAYFGEGALIDPTTPEKFAELAEQQAAEYLGEVQKQCAEAGVECTTATATSDVPYEANDLVDRLNWQYPLVKLLLSSPSVSTLRFVARQFPVLRAPSVVDQHPRMRPNNPEWQRWNDKHVH